MKHTESKLQISCVAWFRLQYPRLKRNIYAVPNGGQRNAITGKILKAEGATAGVSDLNLDVPKYATLNGYTVTIHHGLRIEMKTDKGRQTESQKEFQYAVESQGYKYVICRSFDEFRNEIENYLR